MKKKSRGFSWVPKPDPPQITARPWNRTTVVVKPISGPFKVLTVLDLIETLRTQLGLTPVALTRFGIKLHSIQGWADNKNVNGTGISPKPFIQMEPNSLSTPILDTTSAPASGLVGVMGMCILRDQGTLNNYARCGYTWPESQQNEVLTTLGNRAYCSFDNSSDLDSSNLLFHVNLSYCFNEIAPSVV